MKTNNLQELINYKLLSGFKSHRSSEGIVEEIVALSKCGYTYTHQLRFYGMMILNLAVEMAINEINTSKSKVSEWCINNNIPNSDLIELIDTKQHPIIGIINSTKESTKLSNDRYNVICRGVISCCLELWCNVDDYAQWLMNMSFKTDKHLDILKTIQIINTSVNDPIEYFTKGHCYNFSEALMLAYPRGIAYYDSIDGHVLTKIGNGYYDATGLVVNHPKNMTLLKEATKPHRWSARVDKCSRYSMVPTELEGVVVSTVYKGMCKLAKGLSEHNVNRYKLVISIINDIYNKECLRTIDVGRISESLVKDIQSVVKRVDNIDVNFNIIKVGYDTIGMTPLTGITKAYFDDTPLNIVKGMVNER